MVKIWYNWSSYKRYVSYIWETGLSLLMSHQGWIGTGMTWNGVPLKILATGMAFRLRYGRFLLNLFFVSRLSSYKQDYWYLETAEVILLYMLRYHIIIFSWNLKYKRNRPMGRRWVSWPGDFWADALSCWKTCTQQHMAVVCTPDARFSARNIQRVKLVN